MLNDSAKDNSERKVKRDDIELGLCKESGFLYAFAHVTVDIALTLGLLIVAIALFALEQAYRSTSLAFYS